MALGELVLVCTVIALSTVDRLWSRNIVLNNITKFDCRERITMLDTCLDVNQTFTNGIITLYGIGEQVIQDLATIPILKNVYCICHFSIEFTIYE